MRAALAIAGALALALLVGCDSRNLTVTTDDPAWPVTFRVTDQASIVESVEVRPFDQDLADAVGVAVGHPPGEPGVLQVQWLGADCIDRADLTLRWRSERLLLEVQEGPDACPTDMGRSRTIALVLGRPLDLGTVDAQFAR